jgi:hypothetical protein
VLLLTCCFSVDKFLPHLTHFTTTSFQDVAPCCFLNFPTAPPPPPPTHTHPPPMFSPGTGLHNIFSLVPECQRMGTQIVFVGVSVRQRSLCGPRTFAPCPKQCLAQSCRDASRWPGSTFTRSLSPTPDPHALASMPPPTLHTTSTTHHPPSTTPNPPSTIHHPPSTIHLHHPPSTIHLPHPPAPPPVLTDPMLQCWTTSRTVPS